MFSDAWSWWRAAWAITCACCGCFDQHWRLAPLSNCLLVPFIRLTQTGLIGPEHWYARCHPVRMAPARSYTLVWSTPPGNSSTKRRWKEACASWVQTTRLARTRPADGPDERHGQTTGWRTRARVTRRLPALRTRRAARTAVAASRQNGQTALLSGPMSSGLCHRKTKQAKTRRRRGRYRTTGVHCVLSTWPNGP